MAPICCHLTPVQGAAYCQCSPLPIRAVRWYAADMPSKEATNRVRLTPGARLYRYLMRLVLQLLFLMVLYVASTGPMYWSCYEAYNMNGSRYVAQLYWPVVQACEYKPIGDFLDWYVGLWILGPDDADPAVVNRGVPDFGS